MSQTITRVNVGERQIVLVGTAHVSRESVAEVSAVIAEESPDRVCVELDEGRYRSLTEGSSGRTSTSARSCGRARGSCCSRTSSWAPSSAGWGPTSA